LCNAVGDVIGSTAGTVANAGFGMIAKSFAAAAQTVCSWMWSAISATTTVRLDGAWFRNDLQLTGVIAGVLVLALFVLQLVKGGIRRDPHALARAVSGAGVAFLGAAVAVLVTGTLLALTDTLSDGVVHAAGMSDLAALGRRLTPLAALSGGTLTPALVIVVSLFFVIGSVLVWAVFLIRKALIIVAVVFAPIAFGGAANDWTRSWVRKWLEFTIAMIFSKLVVVVIFTIALSLLGSSGRGVDGLSGTMTGLLLLVLACFAPWLVFKLVHFVGGDILTAHHAGTVRDVKAAATAPMTAVTGARAAATKVFTSSPAAASGVSPVASRAAPASLPAAVPVLARERADSPALQPQQQQSAQPQQSAPPEPVKQPDPPPRAALSRHGVNWGEAT
jgi:hypothetical protein